MARNTMGLPQGLAARVAFCLMVLLVPLCAAPRAFALDSGGGIPTWVEYAKRVKATQQISALENGFAGERVSLSDDSTSFSVIDIDIPGNFVLPVQLARRMVIELQPQDDVQPYDSLLRGAGNWEVDVPFMAATYPTSTGWNAQRCSQGSVPGLAFGPNMVFSRGEAWQGIAICPVPLGGEAVQATAPAPLYRIGWCTSELNSPVHPGGLGIQVAQRILYEVTMTTVGGISRSQAREIN